MKTFNRMKRVFFVTFVYWYMISVTSSVLHVLRCHCEVYVPVFVLFFATLLQTAGSYRGQIFSVILKTQNRRSRDMSALKERCSETVQSLFHRYCLWLAKNPALSKEYELGVKLSSYLLVHFVDKGSSSDTTHQIVYCLSDVLSFLNDFAVSKAYPNAGLPYGNNLRTWLTVVEYCEVCFELGAEKTWGSTGKWTSIFLIQLFKCTARLILLLKKNEGLLPFPPIVPLKREALAAYEMLNTERSNFTYRLNSGVVIRRTEAGSAFGSSSSPGEDFKSLVRDSGGYSFDGLSMVGEILFAVKPLIHLGAVKLTGRNSWIQWLTSLALECVSLRLQWKDFSKKNLTEDQEWQYVSRIVSLLVYLVRSPFYDRYVKLTVLSILYGFRKVFPFLKFILDPMVDFLPAWHQTYFYLWSH